MVYLIDLEKYRFYNIMPYQFKIRVAHERKNIFFASGEKIVQTQNCGAAR